MLILILSQGRLMEFKKVKQEKMKNNNIILLNPSLNDLFQDNIYKLEINEETHYIPLWHDEVIIDKMIIKNIPDISENITILKNHDIIIKETAAINNLFTNDSYVLSNNSGLLHAVVVNSNSIILLYINSFVFP